LEARYLSDVDTLKKKRKGDRKSLKNSAIFAKINGRCPAWGGVPVEMYAYEGKKWRGRKKQENKYMCLGPV